MKIPNIIEVRYKPFKKLDYISGHSILYVVNEVPSVIELLDDLNENNDELSIRKLPLPDMLVFAKEAYEFKVSEEIAERFYDIVGEEQPDEEIIIEAKFQTSEDIESYYVTITSEADAKLVRFYEGVKYLKEFGKIDDEE
jgi:hypothetical protein